MGSPPGRVSMVEWLAVYGIIAVFGVPITLAAFEKTRMFIKPYLGGFAAVLIAYVMEGHITNLDPSFNDLAVYYAPVIEEFAKALAIIAFTKIRVNELTAKKGETPKVWWFWITIGLGFGMAENGLYTLYLLDDSDGIITILFRTIFPVTLHIGTACLTGWLIEYFVSGEASYRRAMVYSLILAAPAMVIHFLYNMNALNAW